jgi:hypothetical protein
LLFLSVANVCNPRLHGSLASYLEWVAAARREPPFNPVDNEGILNKKWADALS